MDFHLRRLLPPVVADGPQGPADVTATASNVLRGALDVQNADTVRVMGADDFTATVEQVLTSYANQTDNVKVRIVAVAGPAPQGWDAADPARVPTTAGVLPGTSEGAEEAAEADLPDVDDPAQVIGQLTLVMPRNDNTHLAYGEPVVSETWWRRGVGTALLAAAEQVMRQEGRTTLSTWTSHPFVTEQKAAELGERLLVPKTGQGRLAPDQITAFGFARDFVLHQCERHSILAVAEAAGGVEALIAQAQERAGADYRVHVWQGVTPEQWREPMCRLKERMSVDCPDGDLNLEEEVWTPERLVRSEEGERRLGTEILTVVAEHVPTGRLVAYTTLHHPDDKPAVAMQEDTLVHGDHRGHRLGMLVKAHALRAMVEAWPQVERIHTWNAVENEHMLAINDQLGFQQGLTEGAWEKTIA